MCVARFEFGSPSLTLVEVVKETEKTIVVGKTEKVIGYLYVGRRLLKDQSVFETEVEALAWLVDRADAHRLQREKDYKAAAQQYLDLRFLLATKREEQA